MKLSLRPPTGALRSLLQKWIDEQQPSAALGAWPDRFGKENGVLLIHGNQAYLWYLSPAGEVLALDTDTSRQELFAENEDRAINAVAWAARRTHLPLKDLLPERPTSAPDCPVCRGTGDEDQWGACRCHGLGWIVPP